MALAVYGKHPAKGDFLEYGLPAALKPALEGWLDSVLAEAKASLGADWQAVWPNAPMVRFWVGEGIWGAPVAGVMASAQDRVGRRFPLVLLALGDAGATLPPPVIDPAQTWYSAACAHLGAQLLRDDLPGPAALLQDAPQPALTDAPPGPRDFWAVRPGADVDELLGDIALTDHRRANEGRSYWWVAGTPITADESDDVADQIAPDPESADLAAVSDALAQDEDTGSGDQNADVTSAEVLPGDEEPPVDAENVLGTNAEPWGLPDTPEPDASPFAFDIGGQSLFAPPEPGFAVEEAAYVAPQILGPIVAKPLWSQVWAGAGLPSGAVLAWFFRGHAGND